jgi:hypothetical protein
MAADDSGSTALFCAVRCSYCVGACSTLLHLVLQPLCVVWHATCTIINRTLLSPLSVLQVIGNTGSNSTGEALHATEQGFAVGMHAALQINPYYGKTSKAGLVAHFDAVLKEGPAIIYNVPGRTGQDIPDDIVHHIASHPNFLGMKECTGNERIGKYTKQVCEEADSMLDVERKQAAPYLWVGQGRSWLAGRV